MTVKIVSSIPRGTTNNKRKFLESGVGDSGDSEMVSRKRRRVENVESVSTTRALEPEPAFELQKSMIIAVAKDIARTIGKMIRNAATGMGLKSFVSRLYYVLLTLVLQECKIELEKRLSQINNSVNLG